MGLGGAMVAGDLIQGAMDIGGQLIVNHQNQKNSAHAYQRTVNDLLHAGLNPMLAYSQGPTANAQMSAEGFTEGAKAFGAATTANTVGKTQFYNMAAAQSASRIAEAQATSAGTQAEYSVKNAELDLQQKQANIIQTINASDLTDAQKQAVMATLPGLSDLQKATTESARAAGHSAEATAKRTESQQTEANAQQKAWKSLDALDDGKGGAMAKLIQILKLLLAHKGE